MSDVNKEENLIKKYFEVKDLEDGLNVITGIVKDENIQNQAKEDNKFLEIIKHIEQTQNDEDASKELNNSTLSNKIKENLKYYFTYKEKRYFINGNFIINTKGDIYKKYIKVAEKLFNSSFGFSNSRNSNSYDRGEDIERLGESLTLLTISGLTGGKMKGQFKNLKSSDLKVIDADIIIDRFMILFSDIKEIDKSFYKDKTIFDVMESFASRAVINNYLSENPDLDENEKKKYLVIDNNKKNYKVGYAKNSFKTKYLYRSVLNNFHSKFDEGMVRAIKKCAELNKGEGGQIKDPITKRTLEVAPNGLIKKGLKNFGGFLSDALGFSNGKDIYSRLFRLIATGIKENGGVFGILRKMQGKLLQENKKLSNKVLEGRVNETLQEIAEAKKRGETPK